MSERNCVAAEVLSHYRAVGGDDTVVIGYLEKRSTEGAGMSETAMEHWNHEFAQKEEPDPTVSALDALRSAVVAQTALLRSLSEQVRIGFEAHYAILKANQNLLQGIDAVGDASRLECGAAFEGLEKRASRFKSGRFDHGEYLHLHHGFLTTTRLVNGRSCSTCGDSHHA